MISFKEFLSEAITDTNVAKSWTSKEINSSDIPKLYKQIVKYCPNFQTMLENGGVLFRGWNYKGMSLESSTYIVDTSKSKRYSRDTNNFYQVCFDYSPALKGIPSRSNSLICATHFGAAMQHGNISIIIPFGNLPLATFSAEDLFFHEIEGETFEAIGYFVENYVFDESLEHGRFIDSDIPKIKQKLEKLTSKFTEESQRHYILQNLFLQFKDNRFDNFINKYFTPSKLKIKIYHPGDKLPIANNNRKSDVRANGNEVWFSGKSFSIDEKTWFNLVKYAQQDLKIKVHANCKPPIY